MKGFPMSDTPSLAHTLATTSQASPHRACFLLRVRPEKLAEYADVHQRVWDEMRQALSDAGWRHYSLFLDPDTGLVVGYYEAHDARAAAAAMEGKPKWPSTSNRTGAAVPTSSANTSTSPNRPLRQSPKGTSRPRQSTPHTSKETP